MAFFLFRFDICFKKSIGIKQFDFSDLNSLMLRCFCVLKCFLWFLIVHQEGMLFLQIYWFFLAKFGEQIGIMQFIKEFQFDFKIRVKCLSFWNCLFLAKVRKGTIIVELLTRLLESNLSEFEEYECKWLRWEDNLYCYCLFDLNSLVLAIFSLAWKKSCILDAMHFTGLIPIYSHLVREYQLNVYLFWSYIIVTWVLATFSFFDFLSPISNAKSTPISLDVHTKCDSWIYP
jgi:hypothetical protein